MITSRYLEIQQTKQSTQTHFDQHVHKQGPYFVKTRTQSECNLKESVHLFDSLWLCFSQIRIATVTQLLCVDTVTPWRLWHGYNIMIIHSHPNDVWTQHSHPIMFCTQSPNYISTHSRHAIYSSIFQGSYTPKRCFKQVSSVSFSKAGSLYVSKHEATSWIVNAITFLAFQPVSVFLQPSGALSIAASTASVTSTEWDRM